MKFTKTLLRLRRPALTEPEVYRKSLPLLGAVILLSATIWIAGPSWHWQDIAPFASVEKRSYAILFLLLIWLLKITLVDSRIPHPSRTLHPDIQKKLLELKQRLLGAVRFLKKTQITHHGKSVYLNQLPWYLFIGPPHAGKTSLLAHADTHYALHPQINKVSVPTSLHCDWWVTRDVCVLDVPSYYLSVINPKLNSAAKTAQEAVWWKFFLELIKSQRGKQSIDGLIVALPLPEILREEDTKKYQGQLVTLLNRLKDFKTILHQSVPCQLIVTKCDLLNGFCDFFAESTEEEIKHAWSISIPALKKNEKIEDLFNKEFDALIKRLNEQLLWRLHQERDPAHRSPIKDFPLQLERLREYLLDFLKKLTEAHPTFTIQRIYLTSAQQVEPSKNPIISHKKLPDGDIRTAAHFSPLQEPPKRNQTYFIKQVITQGITSLSTTKRRSSWTTTAIYTAAYTLSLSLIILMSALLGKDFEQGIKKTYAIGNRYADYQLSLQQTDSDEDRLIKTIDFLDDLQNIAQKGGKFNFDLTHLLSYYSDKSTQKAQILYQQALQAILLPNLQAYLGNYLKLPVNKNSDLVYAALKSYLMLNNLDHFDASYFLHTLETILPSTFPNQQKKHLLKHAELALNHLEQPLFLDNALIENTRNYFIGMPSFQLSYIILKNDNNNNLDSAITLNQHAVFVSTNYRTPPNMFTAPSFSTVFAEESSRAATEAVQGNWVLGNHFTTNSLLANTIVEQLHNTYLSNYVDTWESLLGDIHLITPTSLIATDQLITNLINNDSPLLHILQTLHDNTYFEPVASLSPKLQSLGELIAKQNNTTDSILYQVFHGLQAVHQELQSVLTADDEQKSAFELLVNLTQHQDTTVDAIAQLRTIAEKAPAPLNNWLTKIANTAWFYLMQDASRYLDLSWRNQVIHDYQTDIMDRYPFANNTNEVDIKKFARFFSSQGTLFSFYNHYLEPLVDTSQTEWRWKQLNNEMLPFSTDILQEIQQAMQINHAFFPNGNNQPQIQFALKPYKLGQPIKSVTLQINNQQFTDARINTNKNSDIHFIAWPSATPSNTSVSLTLLNKQTISHEFSGEWGFFRLISQAMDSVVTKKAVLVNFALNDQVVKYLLSTDNDLNPFILSDLNQFKLSDKISEPLLPA